jgi:dihydroxyacetone kinase-like predicted kinase
MRDEGFGFETMFMAVAEDGKPLDVDGIRAFYESIGESVLVAGDARAIKVHVHNERPDEVLAYALGLGTLSKITIENLDQQTEDVRETRAAAFAGDATSSAAPGGPGPATTPVDGSNNGTFPSADAPALAVVAVAAGEGLAAIFRDFGVQ